MGMASKTTLTRIWTGMDCPGNLLEHANGLNRRFQLPEPRPPPSLIRILHSSENELCSNLVGDFNASDSDSNASLSLGLIPLYPNELNPLVWLDASDASTLKDSWKSFPHGRIKVETAWISGKFFTTVDPLPALVSKMDSKCSISTVGMDEKCLSLCHWEQFQRIRRSQVRFNQSFK